jgi:hypothetical protein
MSNINGHVTRFSDSSVMDEVCVNCGAHDNVPGGMGDLNYACPSPGVPYKTLKEYYAKKFTKKEENGK